ncbi:MAG TPA: hypothetical protein VGK18_13145 [Propionicimonas sp.]|jgi:hypothetical protein|uniref:hypothetical protein n=1 Tax=Propionicimonas sp. TaxID=1955623 RepID=UPI002F3FAC18
MKRSIRQVHVIGALSTAVVVLTGPLLVVAPLYTALRNDTVQTQVAEAANNAARLQLAELAKQNSNLTQLRSELEQVRGQITRADELRDASALASAAARSSGARIVEITFGDRQVFVAPAGSGLGDDGTPAVPLATPDPNTVHVQLPVTFEVEVPSTASAATFIEGLRSGQRMLQVVQAQCSPTNDAKRFTLTVDALMFAAKG